MKCFVLALMCVTNVAFAQSGKLSAYDGNNITLSYPSDWRVDESGKYGPKLFLFSPVKEGDAFSENVNLVTEDIKGVGIGIDKYYEVSIENIKKVMTNYKHVSSSKQKDANGEYYTLEYTCDQGQNHINLIQRFWIVNEVAYVLTAVSEQTQVENYRKTYAEIAKTFRIKK